MGATNHRLPRIPKPHPTTNENPLVFSFKHLDLDSNTKFRLNLCTHEFLGALFKEVKRPWTVDRFCEFDNERHSHFIYFEDTTEPNGFPGLNEQLEPEFFWQIALQGDWKWRIHGFLIDAIFYIVWLDPNHLLDTSN